MAPSDKSMPPRTSHPCALWKFGDVTFVLFPVSIIFGKLAQTNKRKIMKYCHQGKRRTINSFPLSVVDLLSVLYLPPAVLSPTVPATVPTPSSRARSSHIARRNGCTRSKLTPSLGTSTQGKHQPCDRKSKLRCYVDGKIGVVVKDEMLNVSLLGVTEAWQQTRRS